MFDIRQRGDFPKTLSRTRLIGVEQRVTSYATTGILYDSSRQSKYIMASPLPGPSHVARTGAGVKPSAGQPGSGLAQCVVMVR